MNLIKELR
uniref:Uncharacterized protein n=1 Tax=Arundo donax TaxID=35708 RepID=A0A0A8XXP2_ARUDO